MFIHISMYDCMHLYIHIYICIFTNMVTHMTGIFNHLLNRICIPMLCVQQIFFPAGPIPHVKNPKSQ